MNEQTKRENAARIAEHITTVLALDATYKALSKPKPVLCQDCANGRHEERTDEECSCCHGRES